MERSRRRGRPRTIDQDRIVEAAVELGLDRFTMQGLAAALGVSTPALYTHVAGRDEVLALAGAALRDRVRSFTSDATTWRGWLTDFAGNVREHLAPSAGAVLGDGGAPELADRVGIAEDGIALLLADGFSAEQAGYAVWLVFRLALTAGSVKEPSVAGFVREATPVLGSPRGRGSAVPATRAVHRALADGRPHDSFAFDLVVVLDGLERTPREGCP